MTHGHRPFRPFRAFSARITLALVTGLLAIPSLASAGEVVAFVGVSGPGLASMSFNNLATPASGNDDVAGASVNWIDVHQKAYNAISYIDMVFAVADSGLGATEYYFTEGVHNGTGIDWTDYHLVLGFGTDGSFVPSTSGDGLDFDFPDQNSPFSFGPFTTIVVAEDTVDAYDGIMPDGTFIPFAFSIDVPDGITEFTIRQLPTIAPVPTESATWGRLKRLF